MFTLFLSFSLSFSGNFKLNLDNAPTDPSQTSTTGEFSRVNSAGGFSFTG